MRRLWLDWDAFWFTPQTTRILSLYRIALGLVVLSGAFWRAPWIDAVYSDAGVFTIATLTEQIGYTPPSVLALGSGPWAVRSLFALLVLAALAFTAGYRLRLSSVALFVLAASFHLRNPLMHNSGDAAIVATLFLFMFAPADQKYSVDRWRRRRGGAVPPSPDPHFAPWVQRAMQCQIALLWFMAGYHKAHGTLWYTGSAMYYIFGQVAFTMRGVEVLMNYPLVYTSLTVATVLTELAIPFLLWFRGARPYAVAMVLGIQLWILVFMTLPVFPLYTLASTLLFFDEDELCRRHAAWRQAGTGWSVTPGNSADAEPPVGREVA